MIETKELINKVRYKVKDLNKTHYSDYDILQAINEVVGCINQSVALKNSDFLEKAKEFEVEYENQFEVEGLRIPHDLIVLVDIADAQCHCVLHPIPAIEELKPNTYKIVGEKIYTKHNKIKLLYRARIPELDTLKDDILLPDFMKQFMINTTCVALGSTGSVLAEEVTTNLERIIPGRRYVNARIKMPFMI